jgi:hypothetical protein
MVTVQGEAGWVLAFFAAALLGLSAAFCFRTSDFISRGASRKMGYYRVQIYINLLSLVGLIAITPFLAVQFSMPPFAVFVMCVTSLLGFFSGIFIYRACFLQS